MSLGSFKWLLSDGWTTYDTYLPILTTYILRDLQRFTVAVGKGGAGTYDVIPDGRNEREGICDSTMNGGNCCIRVYCEFLLEAES